MKTGKHKILIFSQFVKMLELIKDELAKQNIEYEYLDGAANNASSGSIISRKTKTCAYSSLV